MKKFSRILCAILVVVAMLSLNTAVFAEEETEYVYQILGPLGTADENGNLVLSESAELEADLGAGAGDAIAWDVISGKDVLSLTANPNNPKVVLATPVANGEATVVAYTEDGSNILASCKVIVEDQEVAEVGVVTLSASVEGAGNMTLTTADSTLDLGPSYTRQLAPGTVIDLTAVETTQPFKYWVVRRDSDKEIIATTEKNYKFTLAANTTIAAVFDKTDDGSMFGSNALFVYDNIVASNMYVRSLAKNAPSAPYQRNKIFDAWTSAQADASTVLADGKVSMSELNGATTFTATYTDVDVDCAITVIGGSGSGTYKYGAPVSVTAAAPADADKPFLFWSKDGAPVSYDATYQFSAMQDCTVCAVYGTAIEGDGINMVMQAPVVSGSVIAFTFERYVPASYEFVTSGFVVSKSSECLRSDTNNLLMQAVSYRDGGRTQLTKSLNMVSGVSTYYARGYVIYKDNGVLKTVYSDVQRIVVE